MPSTANTSRKTPKPASKRFSTGNFTNWDSPNSGIVRLLSDAKCRVESYKELPHRKYNQCDYKRWLSHYQPMQYRYRCYLDIEPTGKMYALECGVEAVPGIRDLTVLVVDSTVVQLTDEHIRSVYEQLEEGLDIRTDSIYARCVKSVRTDLHLQVFDELHSRFGSSILYIAHNGFQYDFKIILDLLRRNDRAYWSDMAFSDSLVMMKNRKGDAKISSYTNSALFKMIQSDWQNYYLLTKMHSSIGDVLMMAIWTTSLGVYEAGSRVAVCTGARLCDVYKKAVAVRKPSRLVIRNPFDKR
ncbi:Orf100 [Heliothis zea nudivirus]|uniref:Orf100 n=1 Tax=Heliothis zea nudivirus 1 TaxID=3116536 RepID=Q8JKL3_9VIRU|nr:Orf100 [Heliothis zea nudivirus]AAN04394.1 Orf100 [Heliothis zea nudivirus]